MSATNATAPTKTAATAYSQFKTNPETERKGVVLDYGTYYIRVARAGGANKLFDKAMKRNFDPHRRSIQTETMQDSKLKQLMRQAYAEGVVLGWGYKVNEDDKEFVDGKFLAEEEHNGEMVTVVLDFTVDNVAKVFADLPDLFTDVQEQANKLSLYRDEVLEADAKN